MQRARGRRCSRRTRRRRGARHAVVEIDDEGDFRVYAIELPPDLEERLLDEARERALEELERLEAENGERSHTPERRRPRHRLGSGARRAHVARGRDPGELRPHRRSDGQAGDPAADPRSGASDDVRGVHRPRQRGRHRHRPAGGRPQQRARRPRQGRGAPASLRAGRRRALRAGQPHQGRDHRGPLGHEGPAGDPLTARS